ncbi:hypothetical protein D3C85_1654840 [compost metagenome]
MEVRIELGAKAVDGVGDFTAEMGQVRVCADQLIELGDFGWLDLAIRRGDQQAATNDGLHQVAVDDLLHLGLGITNFLAKKSA